MMGSLASNIASSLIIDILLDVAIFNIIYSTMNSGVRYLRNVLIYTICFEVKQVLMTGIASFGAFLVSFGIYFVIGLIVIGILSKIAEYFPRISFIATSIVLQFIVSWVIGMLI